MISEQAMMKKDALSLSLFKNHFNFLFILANYLIGYT